MRWCLDGLIDIDDLRLTSSDISKLIEVYLLNYSVNEDLKEFVSFTTNEKIYKLTGIYRICYFLSQPEIIYIYGNSDILYYYNDICKLNFNVFRESFNFYVESLGRHRHFIKSGYLSNLIYSSQNSWDNVGDLKLIDCINCPVFLNFNVYFNDLISLDTSLTHGQFNDLHRLLTMNDLSLTSDILLDFDLSSPDLLSKLNSLSNYVNGHIDIILYDVNDLSFDLLSFVFESLNLRICFHSSLMRHYSDGDKVYLRGREIGYLNNNILIVDVS